MAEIEKEHLRHFKKARSSFKTDFRGLSSNPNLYIDPNINLFRYGGGDRLGIWNEPTDYKLDEMMEELFGEGYTWERYKD